MQNKILVQLPGGSRSIYRILLGEGLLKDWLSWLPLHAPDKQIVIVTDKIVEHLYANKFRDTLIKHGYNVLLLSIEPGEESKVQSTKEYVELEMLKAKFGRNTLLIAFGGGVVGDLSGFVAATYMRGIKYIQIPTTLLSMIDSSVGGKTAINTPYGKNMIGAFWQPQQVVMDLNLLNSLPKVQLVNGLVEALKIYLTSDAKSFKYASLNLNKVLNNDYSKLQVIIRRAVRLKVQVVKADEREENLRMILNFGHTIAHAIEKLSNFQVLHGYAVGLGILVEAKIAQLLGILSADNYQLISDVFARVGITRDMLSAFDSSAIIEASLGDKKNHGGKIYCVLLKNIGEVYTENEIVATAVDEKYIHQAFKALV
jgi:3-dehydroquinate synthase